MHAHTVGNAVRENFTGEVLSRDSVTAEKSYNFVSTFDSGIDANSGYMPARWAVRVVPDVFRSVFREARSYSEAFNLDTMITEINYLEIDNRNTRLSGRVALSM